MNKPYVGPSSEPPVQQGPAALGRQASLGVDPREFTRHAQCALKVVAGSQQLPGEQAGGPQQPITPGLHLGLLSVSLTK